jgi:DNA-binding IclR family transcriptional regulator
MIEADATDSPAGGRRGIQSVETGMRVLAALAEGGGAQALTAIGQRAGISPSQAHRYLQSLVSTGMAVQGAASRYDLGPVAIAIGLAALARLDVFARADAAMVQFTLETGRTALLSVWGEAGAVVVRWFPGRPALHTSIGIGSVLPLLHSAAGQVFLAYLAEGETQAALAREREQDHTVLRQDLGALRGRVRSQRHAVGGAALTPGLRQLAAPVFNLQGRLSMVAQALASDAFALEEDEAVLARLLAACQAATEQAGGVWPTA